MAPVFNMAPTPPSAASGVLGFSPSLVGFLQRLTPSASMWGRCPVAEQGAEREALYVVSGNNLVLKHTLLLIL